MTAFFKRFQHDVRAIGFLGLSLFLALALFSYNPRDPSFNSIGQGLKTLNYCGLIGSFLADLFYQAFGLPSWIAVAAFFHASLSSFQGQKVLFKDIRHILAFALVALSSALVTIYFPQTKLFSQQIYPGGLVGLGVASGFQAVLNSIGSQVILWTLSLLLFVFYFEFSLQEITEKPLKKSFQIFSKIDLKPTLFSGWSWPNLKGLKKESDLNNKKMTEDEKQKSSSFLEKFLIKKNDSDFKKEQTKENLELHKPNSEQASLLTTSQLNKENKINDESQDSEADFLDNDENEAQDSVEVSAYEPPATRKVMTQIKVKKVENWTMPKLSLLEDPPLSRIKIEEKEIRKKADITLDKLKQFGVGGQIVAAKPGPVVTMFEFKPNADVRVNKVTELADDLSLALSAESLRIIAPIPGRDVIGIETSNSQRETVYLKDLLADEMFWSDDLKLPIALGKQTNGEPRIVDLRKMPHLLIAGTTGSGKSVFTVSTITGFLFKHSPKTLRMILVDPKQVDLAAFSDIPHLIMPPIRDPKKAVFALRWGVKEMEKRYKSMSKFGARNIEQFNEIVSGLNAGQIIEHEKVNAEYETQGILKLEQYYFTPQPYIVIAVEEFGDLMAVDKQNVEQNIVRLAQMARACGMHLILAMQSPRKEVVTGLIKTNIPGRISFKVASKMDSRIILDEQGAERLLSQGDMLFIAGSGKSIRHHGPFLKETEINKVAKFWSDQGEPEFDALALRALEGNNGQSNFAGASGEGSDFDGDLSGDEEYDEKYDEILSWAASQKAISASLIQRRFKLGYPRAARLIEVFEKEGVVGPANGSKPRAVLVQSHQPS